ncbi:sarcosine oxidase subunit gamma family protein [Pelagibacteraceae bacterium]|jgi:heterotetrameric sarcosine oxidase gamma subunit|nr:sarcosine oxidase subunit gamma family protein [Pelagibacteraceae bacterium]
MTAISPLQLVHKKGLFGDHHKKNESDLLNIAEIKNLNIFQIVHYKNSTTQLNNIKIEGLEIPSQNLKVSSNKDTRILWNAPNTWLIISNKENLIKTIEERCGKDNFAITDISHSRAIIQIKGRQAKEVLKKGCPINFNEFKKNSSVGSVFHGINIVIDCIDDESQIFNLFTLRSFGESLYHHVTDASLEFGYVGI